MNLRRRLDRLSFALPPIAFPPPAGVVFGVWAEAVRLGVAAWAVLAGRGLQRHLERPGAAEALGPERLAEFEAWARAFRSDDGLTLEEAAARFDVDGYTAALRRDLQQHRADSPRP